MADLQFRQGTVYENEADGARLLLIHHDPMNLRSMAVPGSPDGNFDCAVPAMIAIDDIIALRKSGSWRELGDVPPEVFAQILDAVINTAGDRLPENDLRALKALKK